MIFDSDYELVSTGWVKLIWLNPKTSAPLGKNFPENVVNINHPKWG